MTVNEGRDQAAIGKTRYRGMVRLGLEARDGFIPIPHRFDLVTVLVEVPTAITMRDVIGVVILKSIHVCLL